MRIHHFLFWVFATVGVSSFDHNLQNRTNQFIKNRLIPALKENGVRNIKFNLLKLCVCSPDIGCRARTRGWMATFGDGLTSEERELYANTCYTDGSCYQNSHNDEVVTDYGCIDKSRNENALFHDSSSKLCQNVTIGQHRSAWVCCQDYHFCANSTELVADQHIIESRNYWIIVMAVIGISLLVLIFVVMKNTTAIESLIRMFKKSRKIDPEEQRMKCLHGLSDESDQQRLVDSDYEPTPSEMPMTEKPRSEQVNTMSTMVSESPLVGESPEVFSPFGQFMIERVNKFCDFVDDTDSGVRVDEGGTGTLQEKTIADKTILGEAIGDGRFGKVFVGLYDGDRVAIKTMNSSDETSFAREVAVLKESRYAHANILNYIGATRKVNPIGFDNWLITAYHRKGSLYQYLLENVIDFTTFLMMTRSIVNGLHFLHSETVPGTPSDIKPKMAHRDIKSRNILVKDDNTCCIADFGLAIVSPPRGENLPESITKSSKCGTIRYLAPEILNESIVIDAFESYMATDIYAFSLVMWETLARCNHRNVVAKESAEAVPYIEWTGRDPNEKTMKGLVCEEKLRPTFSESWRKETDFGPVLEVMSACWNGHPGARYTSSQLAQKMKTIEEDYKATIDSGFREKLIKERAEEAEWRRRRAEEDAKLPKKDPAQSTYRQDAIKLDFCAP